MKKSTAMGAEISKNQELAKLSFYGIGGVADEVWKIGDRESLRESWADTIAEKIPKFVLGSGSNCVFSDRGFRGRIFILTDESVEKRGNFWTINAGKKLQNLVEESAAAGFEDLKNLSGIPGTIGGAVRGNAGAFGCEICDAIAAVEFFDDAGNLKILKSGDCDWNYRSSIFKKNPDWCVARAVLRFEKIGDPEKISAEVKNLKNERWQKYPPGRSGGSFFKNPRSGTFSDTGEKFTAGKLLEKSGAKKDRIGAVEISEKHANFFLNLGNAKQDDLVALARKWKKIVAEKFGVELEPEIAIVDEWGGKVEI
ncbi:UDP-N-acetylmuramate dehydrogenase [bacterium]|nr:UDP-N-acetylmuramate dehydrogenase [bacterium]MBT6831789.1 UDP-N-acetylmuramate dehydrogenase [bacterium]MBT6995996.1 UDP-N-acetylmuramate dehydrogenase [bacterium]MBT7772633.1 UDP-N-acetylmuramate dehydrogenase [bacterium]